MEEIQGEASVHGVVIRDVATGQQETLAVDGVFIFIGFLPNTGLVRGQVALDEGGAIVADTGMHTNLSLVYAVGDVRAGAWRQIATSAADGAIAAMVATHELAAAHPTQDAVPLAPVHA